MRIQIGKWGNNLAVRFPKELVDRHGLKDGDAIDAAILDAALTAAREKEAYQEREEAFVRIAARRRPLPADYKFDREEANAR